MEENKKLVGGSSSSSLASELFCENGSTGILSSIFPPPSKVPGICSSASELFGALEKNTSVQEWKKEIPDEIVKDKEGKKSCAPSRSIFQERIGSCPLSSSLYYGGQEDMYVKSSSTQSFGSHTTFKKNEGEADPINNSSTSRGNWWDGSVYY